MTSIRVLKTFAAIAQHGSFAAAADKIGLTQSAVSLQMSGLESELRRQLFDRANRVAKLNSTGQAMLPRIEQIIKDYETLRMYSPEAPEYSGTISIGALVSVIGALSHAMAKLKSIYPKVEFRISTGQSNELSDRVLAEDLDAAFAARFTAVPQSSLIWTPLYAEPMVLVAHRNMAGKSVRKLLETEPFIRLDHTQQTGMLADKVIKRLNVSVNEILELNSVNTIVDLVRQEIGIAIVPLLRYSNWNKYDDLKVWSLPEVDVKRTIGVFERRHYPGNKIIQLLKDEMSEIVR